MMLRIALLSIAILGWSTTVAQKAMKDLKSYWKNFQQQPSAPIPNSVFTETATAATILDSLEPYLSSSDEQVSDKAFYIVGQVGKSHPNPDVRAKAVTILSSGLNDRYAGRTTNILQVLTRFQQRDFLPVALDSIRSYILPTSSYNHQAMRLAGFLQLMESREQIRQIVERSSDRQTKWSGTLALARMGDDEAIDFILTNLSTTTLNDQFITYILPGLVYTRQKAIFKEIDRFLLSEEKGCRSRDPDASMKIDCGYQMIEYMAAAIEGCPLKVDFDGGIDTDDYPQALRDLREFVRENPDYALRRDYF